MGIDQMIMGSDIDVRLSAGARQIATLESKSLEMTTNTEILRYRLLGETTDRRDEVYRGVGGRLELYFSSPAILGVIRLVVDRSRRRQANIQLNIKATLRFPGGQRAQILIPNPSFGPWPMNFSDGAAHGTIGIDFESSDWSPVRGIPNFGLALGLAA